MSASVFTFTVSPLLFIYHLLHSSFVLGKVLVYTITMYFVYSFAWSLTCLIPLQARGSNAQDSTTAATVSMRESSTANPICFQSRSSADSVPAMIQSSMSSDNSINKACDPSTQQSGVIPWTHTFYVLDNYLLFNISLQDLPSISAPTSTPTSYPGNQNCILAFNAIVSSCVSSRSFREDG